MSHIRSLPAPGFSIQAARAGSRVRRTMLLGSLICTAVSFAAEPAVTVEPISSKEEFTIDYQKPENTVLSPDGRPIAYVANRGSRKVVVMDGKTSPAYSDIEKMRFTADSSKLVFVGKRGKTSTLVTITSKGVRESSPVAAIQEIHFSPKGDLFVATFQRNERQGMGFENIEVIYGDNEGPFEDACYLTSSIKFSPDGRHFAYAVFRAIGGNTNFRQHHLVFDGVAGPPLKDFVTDGSGRFPLHFARLEGKDCVLVLAAEESRFNGTGAWIAQDASGAQRVLQSRVPRQGHGAPNFFALSANGEHYAVLEVVSPEKEAPGKPTADYRVLRDGKEVAKHLAISSNSVGTAVTGLTISPDGSRVAYALQSAPAVCHLYIGGQKGDFDYALCGEILFSPDGKRTASIVRTQGNETFVVVDGEEYGPYSGNSGIRQLRFSPDSKHCLFLTNDSNSKHFLVVDGKRFEAESDLNLDNVEYLPDGTIAFVGGTHRFVQETQYGKGAQFLPTLITLKGGAKQTIPMGGPPLKDVAGGKVYVALPDAPLPAGLRTIPHTGILFTFEGNAINYEYTPVVSVGGAVAMRVDTGNARTLLINGLPAAQVTPAPFEERFAALPGGKIAVYTVVENALARVVIDPTRLTQAPEVVTMARVEPEPWA
ncbi:MAG TPA: hypothetical protein VHN79_09575, partial [Lacunisphaera sp.]|nr:hypothetical protein [Lacunisphaera sp.]